KEPLKATLEPLQKTIIEGLEVGDIEFAGYAAMHYCSFKFVAGENLEIMDQTFVENIDFLRGIHQSFPLEHLMIWRQMIVNLLGRAENVTRLIGEYFDEDQQLSGLIEKGDKQSSCCIYLAKTLLTYLFGEYAQSVQAIDLAEQNLDGITGLPHLVTHNFYSSLTRLANYPHVNQEKQNAYLEKIHSNQENLKKWSQFAPWNCQHKYDLVAAELFRISGEKLEAMELYDQAIAGAKENGYLQEEAIANELAAKFYLDWNKEKLAAPYLQEAYYCYACWGSKAKIEQLEIMYSRLLTPVLQRSQPSHNSNLSQTSSPALGTFSTTISTLDFASVIKASRTISEEITLDSLLSKLMKILLENAGADQVIFILENEKKDRFVAQCVDNKCNLSNHFQSKNTFPQSIINRVKRTRETVLINQLKRDTTFTTDPYFLQSQPKSLLCTPILNQGKLVGILYLENHLTTDAFTPERLEILNLLTAQAAISIENAQLYQHLERYSHNLEDQVQQRTQQLQEKNQHLQQTLNQLQLAQTKLIQTEKMSSLGKMVAGIAHEMNNPIAFIEGNIYHARTYFHDLLELLNLYQENLPNPDQKIQDKIEEIDLNFLSQDLEKLLNSIQTGSDRISQIVLSLRNFSRLHENGLKQVDLHEGLENTLLILQHRLAPNGSSPAISILKNYAEIPLVNCFPNQLNQVFLQILSNAIDALMMLEVGSSPEISITTERKDASTVSIKIADSGMGMSEDIQHRIFDPFFTTKPVGQGTGLGLSISYQIITEQHQGELRCISQVGQGTEFIIDLPI
ncbi:MAG: ATP-binding protein, partial [Cyanobacteriota bacterium]|nr:ATP-binding protein [Cyanobacteriota bacterium]